MKFKWVGSILAILLLQGTPGGAVEIGLFNPYITDGARISPETLVPTLRKWYLPQALYSLYGWQGSGYTNYARDQYRRYVRTELEGDRYYDLYGNSPRAGISTTSRMSIRGISGAEFGRIRTSASGSIVSSWSLGPRGSSTPL